MFELNRLIADFEKILPKFEFTLCLQNNAIDQKDSIAIHGNQISEICSSITCSNCAIKNSEFNHSYLIKSQNKIYGELRIQPKHRYIPIHADSRVANDNTQNKGMVNTHIPHHLNYLSEQNNEAIIALSNMISTALSLLDHRQQKNQIILLEERATIARELHDSLAQSLSYLKIQVSILEQSLNKVASNNKTIEEANYDNIISTIAKLKEGLNSSYQHLRDLLVTFRLSIDDDGFDIAFDNSVKEFAQKGGFEVNVDNQIMAINLSASEQVNLIQIIRESLSNINRHANANYVSIRLGYNEDNKADCNEIMLVIKDDGVGIDLSYDQTHHHGIKIMKERAHSLGGTLTIDPNPEGGTIITVCFEPLFFKKEAKNALI